MCGAAALMADAHIFPKALVRDLVEDPGAETIYSVPLSPAVREKRARVGAKDDTILCRGCEDRFQIYDQVGVETLRKTPPDVPGDPIPMIIRDVDAARLKLFFLHVLWRSHASRLPFLSAARLGDEVAERLRMMLLADDPGKDLDFAVMLLAVCPDPDGMDAFSTSFRRARWNGGVSFYFMQHMRWLVHITTSQEGPPRFLHPFLMGCGGKAHVICGGGFRDTAGFQGMIQSFRSRQRQGQTPRWLRGQG